MALLRVVNLTATDVLIEDVGVVVPASGSADFDTPEAGLIRELAVSAHLRKLVTSGILKLSDGIEDLEISDLYDYWLRAGFDRESLSPPPDLFVKSPDGTRWKLSVDDAGTLSIKPEKN